MELIKLEDILVLKEKIKGIQNYNELKLFSDFIEFYKTKTNDLEEVQNKIYNKENFSTRSTIVINGKIYWLSINPIKRIVKIFDYEKINKTEIKIKKNNNGFSCVNNNSIYDGILKFANKNNKDLKSDGKGWIYLITDKEYTKIGATSYNVKKRMCELQTGNPKKLEIIGKYRVDNKITTEKFIHNKYKEKNILNEWFELDSEEIREILLLKENVLNESEIKFITEEEKRSIDFTLNTQVKEYDDYCDKIIKRNENKKNEITEKFLNNFNFKDRTYIKTNYMLN